MEGLVLLGIVAVPPVLVALLGKTKLWFTGGAVLLAAALHPLTQLEERSSEVAGALNGFGNFLCVAASLVLAGYGLLMLVSGAKRRTADLRRRQVEQPLPVAKVVTSRA